MSSDPASASASATALYPFLATAPRDQVSVLDDLQRSTSEKLREIRDLRRRVVERDGTRVASCAAEMAAALGHAGRLFAFGNGGSSTDAQSLVAAFTRPGPGRLPLPALALTNEVAVVTALGNDVGLEVVFARQLAAFGRAGDIAVGLSTSGSSVNVLMAFDEAKRRGLLTVGLAGYDGGAMAASAAIDHLFVVPSASVHRIQEAQTTIYHLLWQLTHDELARAPR